MLLLCHVVAVMILNHCIMIATPMYAAICNAPVFRSKPWLAFHRQGAQFKFAKMKLMVL